MPTTSSLGPVKALCAGDCTCCLSGIKELLPAWRRTGSVEAISGGSLPDVVEHFTQAPSEELMSKGCTAKTCAQQANAIIVALVGCLWAQLVASGVLLYVVRHTFMPVSEALGHLFTRSPAAPSWLPSRTTTKMKQASNCMKDGVFP